MPRRTASQRGRLTLREAVRGAQRGAATPGPASGELRNDLRAHYRQPPRRLVRQLVRRLPIAARLISTKALGRVAAKGLPLRGRLSLKQQVKLPVRVINKAVLRRGLRLSRLVSVQLPRLR